MLRNDSHVLRNDTMIFSGIPSDTKCIDNYLFIDMRIHVRIFACIHTVYTYTHIDIYTYKNTHVHMHVHEYTYTVYKYTYIYMYMYIFMYIYIYIYTWSRVSCSRPTPLPIWYGGLPHPQPVFVLAWILSGHSMSTEHIYIRCQGSRET